MIRHIVAFRLTADDAAQRSQDADGIKSRLEALQAVIPGVKSLEVHSDLGLIQSHWHVVLVGDYASNDALDAYQTDSRHVEVVNWINTIVADRAVVDYEIA